MKSNSRIARILIATLALGVGLAVYFHGHNQGWIVAFDIAAVTSDKSSRNVFHEYDRVAGTITTIPLITDPDTGKTFQRVIVTDDPKRIFEANPPSALDYAIILESLHNRGYRQVNITTRLTWDEDPGLLSTGLDLRLSLYQSAIIPLAVTRGPKDGDMPEMLERALISHDQIHGNTKLIAMVNRMALPPHLTGAAAGVLAGFHSIESNPPAADHIAMLARWSDKGMIPSYELLTIMQAHGVLPKQLIIHCGKQIRLGNNGPVIPIDVYGQAPTPLLTEIQTPLTPIPADRLITQKKSTIIQPSIAVIHAQGERTGPTNAIGNGRLDRALMLTRAFPLSGNGSTHHRIPIWASMIILFDTALIVFWLKGTSRGNQHLGFALCAALTLPMLYALLGMTHYWMALSPVIATLLTGWLTPTSSRRSTTTIQEYDMADLKPVIRA